MTIDSINYADPETINGLNLYAYCGNNPVNYIDICGLKRVYLYNGWKIRVERHGTDPGKQLHVHAQKGDKDYAQNFDGTPHDEGSTSKGYPPRKVREIIKEKTGLDWNINNELVINNYQAPNILWSPKNDFVLNNILVTPIVNNSDNNIIDVIPETGLSNIESFPVEEVTKGLIVVASIGAVVYAGACIIGAFFTGGQSLWGLAIFA